MMINTHVLKMPFLAISKTALVIAAGTVVPIILHFLQVKGDVFLPIFTSILIASYYLDWKQLMAVAILTPITNMLFTGMPIWTPIPMLQILILELIVFGVVSTFLKKQSVFLNLSISFILARCSVFIGILFLSLNFQFCVNHIIVGIPGMVLNILFAWLCIQSQKHTV